LLINKLLLTLKTKLRLNKLRLKLKPPTPFQILGCIKDKQSALGIATGSLKVILNIKRDMMLVGQKYVDLNHLRLPLFNHKTLQAEKEAQHPLLLHLLAQAKELLLYQLLSNHQVSGKEFAPLFRFLRHAVTARQRII
jgi:hypothetical protein